MADDQQVVRGVSWNEVFSFTHIFRSFKMAVNHGALILALVAVSGCYFLGRAMDYVSGVSDSCVVREDEAWGYWRADSRGAFLAEKDKWVEKTRVDRLVSLLSAADASRDKDKAQKMVDEDGFDSAAAALLADYKKELAAKHEEIDKDHKDAVEAIGKDETLKGDATDEALADAETARLKSHRAALRDQYLTLQKAPVEKLKGKGIFAGLLDWELDCVDGAMGALLRGNIVGGVSDLYKERGRATPKEYRDAFVTNKAPVLGAPAEGLGLIGWVLLMMWGLWWLVSIYPVYAVVFLLAGLAIWALFGGALCRVAALHAAREEKIGIVAAVKFSCSKFFSFFMAPVLPIIILILVGACIGLAGLVGSIPVVGEWLFVLVFLLCLIAGAISAFLLIGLVAGWPLMWPTIAVEGSDSFDAISRSVSYVWNRPFRYSLYWLVAGVYGTICVLFVRLFAFLTLGAVHAWGSWGMGLADRPEYGADATKMDVLWPQPTFTNFHGQVQSEALSGSEAGAAYLLMFCVYLVLAMVLAFMVTFFFSAATNIYYLLRQKMDVTDLDDVYIEEEPEAEDDLAEVEPPAADAPAAEEPAAEPPADDAPAADTGGAEKPEWRASSMQATSGGPTGRRFFFGATSGWRPVRAFGKKQLEPQRARRWLRPQPNRSNMRQRWPLLLLWREGRPA